MYGDFENKSGTWDCSNYGGGGGGVQVGLTGRQGKNSQFWHVHL